MDWMKYAFKLPVVISGITGIINLVKGASHEDKKAAIVAAVQSSVALAEFAAGHDLLKDEAISKLVEAVIDAEAAAQRAREALKDAIIHKAQA